MKCSATAATASRAERTTPRTYPPPTCKAGPAARAPRGRPDGFTLIEALVALAVIVLAAAAALDTLIATHRLELAARESRTLRQALGHALVASRDLDSDWPAEGRRALRGGVFIEALPVERTPGITNAPAPVRWTLSSPVRPSLRAVVYTQPDSLQP